VGGVTLRETSGVLAVVSVSAFGLALAFPRTDWYATPWIVLTPLVVVAISRKPRAAFGWGWLHGTVFFLVLLRWLDHTFRTYSTIPWPLTWLPLVTLAAYCGLYTGVFAVGLAWLARRGGIGRALLLAPFLWIGGEWVRGQLFGGFPWGALGYSQHLRLPVIQIAEIGGVQAVSFLLVAVNAGVAGCLLLPWRRALVGALAGALVVGVALGFGYARLSEPPPPGEVTVAIVQPSIEQPLKFDPEHAAVTLGIYVSLTRQAAMGRPDLIVWPETATPTPLRRDPKLIQVLRGLARSTGGRLLVGSLDVDESFPEAIRNSAFVVGEQGVVGRYDKIHLVPFGEFVPLSGVIGFVRGWAEFISELEPGSRAVVFPGPPAPFGVVICYEGIFPGLVREFVKDGARLMVNMTNDGWFGRTSGPWQHLGMYAFRAVEHRIAVVRAANTGVSAFIAPSGQVLRRLDIGSRAVISDLVPLRSTETLYTRLGDWLVWVAFAVSAVGLGTAAVRRGA